MISFLYSLFGFGGLAAVAWLVHSVRKWGKADIERDNAKEKLEGVRNAKAIHERVDSDSSFREFVRRKFRR